MKTVNIFQVIGETTRRIEPFHSEFLAEALRASAEGNRSLFDAVWRLAAPEGWGIPVETKIESEDMMEDGKRIDICIFDETHGRLLGIEVKTTKDSAKERQLEDYLEGLCKKYGYDSNDEDGIAICYLTPFNRKRAGYAADSLPTVEIFKKFQEVHNNARHISWLDIAEIPWDSNELWRQHQAYVHQEISNYEKLEKFVARDRSFDRFFSSHAIDDFSNRFPQAEYSDAETGRTVDLEEHLDDFLGFVGAFEFLIEDKESVATEANRQNRVSEALTEHFLRSKYGPIHRAIFELAHRYDYVWLAGKKDYGLRVAHKDHSGGISLVRSKGERYLQVGQPR